VVFSFALSRACFRFVSFHFVARRRQFLSFVDEHTAAKVKFSMKANRTFHVARMSFHCATHSKEHKVQLHTAVFTTSLECDEHK